MPSLGSILNLGLTKNQIPTFSPNRISRPLLTQKGTEQKKEIFLTLSAISPFCSLHTTDPTNTPNLTQYTSLGSLLGLRTDKKKNGTLGLKKCTLSALTQRRQAKKTKNTQTTPSIHSLGSRTHKGSQTQKEKTNSPLPNSPSRLFLFFFFFSNTLHKSNKKEELVARPLRFRNFTTKLKRVTAIF